MERIKTGIKGFDNLIEGGFPKGSTTLLSGTPATAKTIFGLEFLINGAEKFNESGLYVSFEEKIEDLENQAAQFNWNIKKLKTSEKLKFISVPASEINKETIKEIITNIKKNNIKRLVIDSLSTLSINTPTVYSDINQIGEYAVKRFIYSFIDELRSMKDTTSLIISQTASDSELSRDDVSEFLCDGIIHVIFESMGGQFSRSLIVRKMRRTKNDEDIHPLEISKNGLVVHSIK